MKATTATAAPSLNSSVYGNIISFQVTWSSTEKFNYVSNFEYQMKKNDDSWGNSIILSVNDTLYATSCPDLNSVYYQRVRSVSIFNTVSSWTETSITIPDIKDVKMVELSYTTCYTSYVCYGTTCESISTCPGTPRPLYIGVGESNGRFSFSADATQVCMQAESGLICVNNQIGQQVPNTITSRIEGETSRLTNYAGFIVVRNDGASAIRNALCGDT